MLTIEDAPTTDTDTTTEPERQANKTWRTRTKVLVAAGVLAGAFVALTAIDLAMAHTTHAAAQFRQPVTAIDASIDGGSLRIVGTNDSATTVDATVHQGLHTPSHSVTVENGRLVIRSNCTLAVITRTCAVDYIVHVPHHVAVKARGNGAGVVIRGVDGDVDVSVNGGRVDIAFDTAPHHVSADSNGGNINIRVPDDGNAYRVGTHTNGGSTNVGVRSDPRSTRTIDVETNGGSIDILYGPAGNA
ncbi:MAG: hypothetical protein ACXVLM_12895 [Ilumatobacteraceae bacterium]